MNKTKLYFPNLNSLRFIAAATVILSHVEQYKSYFGQPYIYFPIDWGGLAVTLFFVLSGFLITYLLLVERKYYGTVSVRSFYVRRILRIWPLYYLIAVLALFILPGVSVLQMPGISEHLARHYWWKVAFILTLFPNLALAAFMEVPYAAQLWSVGVEEQFYLVWPVVMKFTRELVWVLLGITVVVTLLSNGVLRGGSSHSTCILAGSHPGLHPTLTRFLRYCFKIYALAAWRLAVWRPTFISMTNTAYLPYFIPPGLNGRRMGPSSGSWWRVWHGRMKFMPSCLL